MNKRLMLAIAVFAITACSDVSTRPEEAVVRPDTTQRPDTAQAPDTSGIAQRRLIECPTTQTSTNSGLLGVLGGTIAAAGSSISLPAGSLLLGTLIRVTVPASTYMEIDVTADNLVSFLFQRPVTITIDYSRCPASVTAGKTLTVWHINTQTKVLLENMHGVNDPVQRKISFTTDHLSGYAIAQ
jgi:hypothetical protein